jgi:hypothetical protein
VVESEGHFFQFRFLSVLLVVSWTGLRPGLDFIPSARYLDLRTSPVMIRRVSTHSIYVNSPVLNYWVDVFGGFLVLQRSNVIHLIFPPIRCLKLTMFRFFLSGCPSLTSFIHILISAYETIFWGALHCRSSPTAPLFGCPRIRHAFHGHPCLLTTISPAHPCLSILGSITPHSLHSRLPATNVQMLCSFSWTDTTQSFARCLHCSHLERRDGKRSRAGGEGDWSGKKSREE